jgi:subtilisin family serine protease
MRNMPNLRRTTRIVAAIVVAVVAAGGLGAVTPAGAAPAAHTRAQSGKWITLVTGDRVLTRGAGAAVTVARVWPAAGRERMPFHTYTRTGHLYVQPADAAGLVRAGTVDQRLFDVTALLAYGYDDTSRPDLPLIVSYAGDLAAPAARAAAAGARPVADLSTVDALAVRQDKAATAALWGQLAPQPGVASPRLAPGVTHLWLDGRVRATLDHSVPQIGAPAAWAKGLTGKGVAVAVLDTGIDTDHPDLAGAVTAARDFSGSMTGTRDLFGHGTHVASIITGSGAASGGRFVGVAPDATLLNGKVLDDTGSGSESGIIAGMQWAAVDERARVVNMSLGGFFADDGTDPVDIALNQLTAQTGALFVVAAGNAGPDPISVSSPGAADSALTVGAVDGQDTLAAFSSRGPRRGDGAIKPDITAPGVGIVAARAAGSTLGQPVGEAYQRLSGTSMATPHVAGAAAILAGEHKAWTAPLLKEQLTATADPAAGVSVFGQGAGRVDVARAVTQPVAAAPVSLNLGQTSFPHGDDAPILSAVTYVNSGTAPVTLALRADVLNAGGKAAPAGMFRPGVSTLRVPAGGTATATLTTDTAVPGPDGGFTGALVATAPGVTVRTPLAVTKEEESYDVTFRLRDQTGGPTGKYDLTLLNQDSGRITTPYDPSGTVTARLRRGTYFLDSTVFASTPAGDQVVYSMDEPALAVTRAATVDLDARAAVHPATQIDRADARDYLGSVAYRETVPGDDVLAGWISSTFDTVFVRPSRTAAPGLFTFTEEQALARPDAAGGFAGSPYVYHVSWSEPDRIPVPVRRIADGDLAAVPTTIAEAGTPPGKSIMFDNAVAYRPPAQLTAFYTPGPRAENIFQTGGLFDFFLDQTQTASTTYARGRNAPGRWNGAVFGPALPAGEAVAVRAGNQLRFSVPMFSDSGTGHIGQSEVDGFGNVLTRDGRPVPVADFSQFAPAGGAIDVPADAGTYRYATTASRSISALSTRLDVAWTFRSAPAADTAAHPLPLLVLRADPVLDDRNRAPRGGFDLPLVVQRQPGAAGYGDLDTVTAAVSYDDGATWSAAPVTGTGPGRTAHLVHPAQGAFVSLRLTATDTAGNAVEETVIRAYGLG